VKKRILLIFLCLYSVVTYAADVDVPSGKVTSTVLGNENAGIELTIERLNDSDPTYASVTQLFFYDAKGEIGLSVGIMKLDGEQGIASFYQVGGPRSSEVPSLIKSNLNLNTSYAIKYLSPKNGRIVLDVTGEILALNIGFSISKVEHMVSGMKLVDVGWY